ncbi:DUF1800 family protein [Pelagicoccus mobilis]|uniref:DUF1800 family protein n=1 Tax=Pelagicoccus mobilis TaxID=415221 RepID=A0A934RRJ5_9BACT|nr:DUF1800 family protein [Pelagicoccus mobilis]MBK1876250.1 DUF1800 family protein [Pelagicoccus mobilis]
MLQLHRRIAFLCPAVWTAWSLADVPMVDLDGDQMSDIWEIAFDAQAIAPEADEDGDGMSNLQECEHGTDPFDAESVFIAYRFGIVPEGVAFEFSGVDGQSYRLEESSNLVDWRQGSTSLISEGGDDRLVSSAGSEGIRFLRFRVGGDHDGDGLSDFEEKLLGYDPLSQHTNSSFVGGDMARLMNDFFGGGTIDIAGKQVQGTEPTLAEASRFLSQASLKSPLTEIERVAAMGYDAWIDEQFGEPIGYIMPGMDGWHQYFEDTPDPDDSPFNVHRRYAWWEQMFEASDLLRQRIALALSEIYVVSDASLDGGAATDGMSAFYDMLLDHSFGNWRDLLRDVSLSPTMGVYLSHLQNRKANPAENVYPDENYAREIMQLFSIGLFELNPDGTRKQDASGVDIPTYDNEDITNFARVFTGFSYGGPNNDVDTNWHFQWGEWNWRHPMKVWAHEHDTEEKTLLNGTVLPSFEDDPGRTPMDDFEDAIDNLYEHPNVGPFVAYRLIQRLVKSNPSPAYVKRVGQIFDDNGQGVKGDMKALVRAILLDVEARSLVAYSDDHAGRLREPYLRWMRLITSLGAEHVEGGDPQISDWNHHREMGQRAMSSNSVFNFFLPDYVPQGEMAEAGLVGPEFQVLNSSTAMATQNIFGGAMMWGFEWRDDDEDDQWEPSMTFQFTDEVALLQNEGVDAVIDRLDLILCHGTMTDRTREILNAAYQDRAGWFDDRLTVGMLVRIVMLSADFAVTR